MQLSMFDLIPHPPIVLTFDPDGPVVQGPAHETLILPHLRMAWHLAEIELHPHDDMWMWAASSPCCGHRKVGAKWGRFAACRDDAAHYAACEILRGAERLRASRLGVESAVITAAQLRQIEVWAQAIADDPAAAQRTCKAPDLVLRARTA